MVRVIFYGKLASMLGRELDFAVKEPCSIAELRKRIVASVPAAVQLQDKRVRACVGGEIVPDHHPIAPTDEVEFLAPVSGG